MNFVVGEHVAYLIIYSLRKTLGFQLLISSFMVVVLVDQLVQLTDVFVQVSLKLVCCASPAMA
jgi:hypothetical protein